MQEGIFVDVNDSWLQTFKLKDKNELIGTPVMDNFELAMGASSEHEGNDAVVEGVKLVREQLTKVLEK